MLGKILGAVVGAKVAEHTDNVGGVGGALLGAGAVAVLRRMSLPALIAVAVAGYAYTVLSEKKAQPKRTRSKRPRKSPAPATA
jgi:uncharacterized membrane protein YfcA